MRKLYGLIWLTAVSPALCSGATPTEQIQAAADDGKHTFVMFYRSNDIATQQMAKTIQSQVAGSKGRATWLRVNVAQSANLPIVQRFDATRIPLPTVFGLAPNGAVSGVFRQRVQPQQLAGAILSPRYADMIKALQHQKIVSVCLLPAGVKIIPAGVEQFEKDPNFRGRTHRVVASADDAAESFLFKRMRVASDIKSPVVVLFAPPGVFLGKYQSSVTGATLAQKLHSSGKCDCEKCRANAGRTAQGKQRTTGR